MSFVKFCVTILISARGQTHFANIDYMLYLHNLVVFANIILGCIQDFYGPTCFIGNVRGQQSFTMSFIVPEKLCNLSEIFMAATIYQLYHVLIKVYFDDMRLCTCYIQHHASVF